MKVEFDNLTRVIDSKKQSVGILRRKLLELVVVENGILAIDPCCLAEANEIQSNINRVKNEIKRGEDYIELCKQLIAKHNISREGVRPYEEGVVDFDSLILQEQQHIDNNTKTIRAAFMDGKLSEKEIVGKVLNFYQFQLMF